MPLGVKPGQNVNSLRKIDIFAALNGLYHFKIAGNATASLSFVIVKPFWGFFILPPVFFFGRGVAQSYSEFVPPAGL